MDNKSKKEALKIKKQNIILKNKELEQKKEDVLLDRLKESRIERDYYRDNSFKSLGVLFFTILTFASSLTYFYYSYFVYTPPPNFIVLNEEERILEEIDLMQPIMSEEDLTQWVNDSIVDILSYNYLNYDKHGTKIKKYFSETSYSKFSEIFNSLRLQKKVKAQKAIVEATMLQVVKVKQEGSVAGNTRKAWMLEGSVLLNIHGKDGIERVKYKLEVLVIRATYKEKRNGLLIERIQLT